MTFTHIVDTSRYTDDLHIYAIKGLIGEYGSTGEVRKEYGWMPEGEWGTDPLFMLDGGNYYFYHNDHLGTPQKLTDSSGAVVWSAGYSAFGEATVDPASTVINNLRLPGQYYDAETGLHYNWQRYYEPENGRYIQPDPLGLDAGDENLYGYVFNDPVNMYDPTGEIAPVAAGYMRCMLSCMAHNAVMDAVENGGSLQCFDVAGNAKDCALSCLNPANWFGKAFKVVKATRKAGKNGRKLDKFRFNAPPKKRGNAPIGDDGYPVELHHRKQKNKTIDEMTRTDHRLGDSYKNNHDNTGQKPSEINRDAWRKQQKDYWKKEWDDGRFDGM